jgi:hypothetical protein
MFKLMGMALSVMLLVSLNKPNPDTRRMPIKPALCK